MQKNFWDAVEPEVLRHVCGESADGQRAAVVSELLFVLRQTEACGRLLDSGSFYSLQDVLSVQSCALLRDAAHSRTDGTTEEQIDGRWFSIRYYPCAEGLFLLFCETRRALPVMQEQVRRMREVCGNLLIAAGQAGAQSQSIRREAMRLMRQAMHLAVLSGEPPAGEAQFCCVRELLENAAARLRELTGAHVSVRCEVPDGKPLLCLPDAVSSALYALADNSIRCGGADAEIILSARLTGDGCTLCVHDSGSGPDERARRWLLNGWETPGAPAGGLGIPYAARIAEAHGGRLMPVLDADGFSVHLVLHPLSEEQALRADSVRAGQTADPALLELSELLPPQCY